MHQGTADAVSGMEPGGWNLQDKCYVVFTGLPVVTYGDEMRSLDVDTVFAGAASSSMKPVDRKTGH